MPIIEFDDQTPLTSNPVYSFDQNIVTFAGEISTDADVSDGADMILKETSLPGSGAEGIGAFFDKPVRNAILDLDTGPAGAVVVGYDDLGQVIFAEKLDPAFGKASMAFDSASTGLSRVEMFSDPEEMVNGVDSGSLLDTALDAVQDVLDGLLGGGGGAPILELDLSLVFDFAQADFNLTVGSIGGVSNNIPAFDRIFFDRSFDTVIEGTGNSETLTGTTGDDLIEGGAGEDTLEGGAGDDVMRGGSGDDTLKGGAGADVFDGGAGIDTADYSGETAFVKADLQVAQFNGGNALGDTYIGVEDLIGTDLADNLRGNADANQIFGGMGRDLLYGRDGADYLEGNDGNDILEGGAGHDILRGGNGNDILRGGEGPDSLDGGAGYDIASYVDVDAAVTINLGDSTLNSGAAVGDTYLDVESIRGSAFDDSLTGDATNNSLRGEDGDDTIYGLEGFDALFGNGGNDTLFGGESTDVLFGGDGDDILNGQDGIDAMFGGAGADAFDGGSARDYVLYTGSNALILDLEDGSLNTADAAGDTFTNVEAFSGSFFGDVMSGDSANDIFRGLGGNDRLDGRDGRDHMNGGSGNDTLIGGTGDDRLYGGSGEDLLIGGMGNDFMFGGSGADTFMFNAADGERDFVRDFEDGSDILHIDFEGVGFDDLIFSTDTLGAEVSFGTNAFVLTDVEVSVLDESDFLFG